MKIISGSSAGVVAERHHHDVAEDVGAPWKRRAPSSSRENGARRFHS
ncbi:hypothetical protein [Streptomyces griseosporeus]